jgi:predicted GIY-YIG superfamily endonuclease
MPCKFDLKKYPLSTALCDVYLLHFSRPFGHAKHYVGVTKRGVEERVAEHQSGGAHAARLCKLAVQAGITLTLARTWIGVPRYTELKLKNRGKAQVCPICKAERKARRLAEKASASHLAQHEHSVLGGCQDQGVS